MRYGVTAAVVIGMAISFAGCSGDDGNHDAAGGCDPDACTVHCLGDGGGVAACVGDERLCFPLPRDAGDEGEGEAGDG